MTNEIAKILKLSEVFLNETLTKEQLEMIDIARQQQIIELITQNIQKLNLPKASMQVIVECINNLQPLDGKVFIGLHQ
jgi:hypothetical protein